MSRELLRRATDAQVRYERAELAAADKRALRDKAIREARAEHPAARIAQATGLSRERVRQITTLTLTLALLAVSLAVPAGASAMTPLSKRTASFIASSYAEREGHHIWRLQAMGTTVTCKRQDRYQVACAMTDELFYGGYAATPTDVEATLDVRKTTPNYVKWWLVRDWEVLPPPTNTEWLTEEQDRERQTRTECEEWKVSC